MKIGSKVGGRGKRTFKRNIFWKLMSAVSFDFSMDSLGAILATF